jgi:hypothetical protein
MSFLVLIDLKVTVGTGWWSLQAKDDTQSLAYFFHVGIFQMTKDLDDSAFVYYPNLLTKYH